MTNCTHTHTHSLVCKECALSPRTSFNPTAYDDAMPICTVTFVAFQHNSVWRLAASFVGSVCTRKLSAGNQYVARALVGITVFFISITVHNNKRWCTKADNTISWQLESVINNGQRSDNSIK